MFGADSEVVHAAGAAEGHSASGHSACDGRGNRRREPVDDIIIHVAPVLVGDGVRLFERAGGEPVKLEPISSVYEGGLTVLHYSVGRASPS